MAILMQSLHAPAQEGTDLAETAIKNEVQWIKTRVANGDISPTVANDRLRELKVQNG
jgi:hypothetical protein